MAAMNSSVLACSYAIAGTGSSELSLSSKFVSMPSVAAKMPVIRAQNVKASDSSESQNNGSQGRRSALLFLGAALFATATSSANAGPIEDALERSKTNKVCLFFIMSFIMISFLGLLLGIIHFSSWVLTNCIYVVTMIGFE